MRKESLARLGLVAMLTASVAVFGGCLDFLGDDNPNDLPPEIAAALEAAEDDLGEGISGLALESTIGALEGMIQWSEPGGLGGTVRESVIWNAEEQVWVISDESIFEDGDASGTAGYTYWVQFSAGETIQQHPDDFTDRMDIRFEGFQRGNYHPGDFDVDFNLEAASHNVATRNEDNSVDIVGTGEIHGSSQMHLGDRTFSHTHHQDWENDLTTAPDQACVSGIIAGTLGIESDRGSRRFRFEGLFDGQGNVDWTVWHGERVIVEGTEQYECGTGR